nr:hypothetical protein [Tanacetum cinerariifolium]
MSEKKVNTKPVDYAALNQLSQDFKTRFVPQTELSAKQVFWFQNSVNSEKPNLSTRPTQVEVPKELSKVSMVNTSLKKLKHHLASFDVVVKERTTAIAITEGTWGFEHTKSCFRDEIIPFVKALKDLFNSFDQFLIDELSEVQNVFHQMEQVIEQHRVESNRFQVKMNKVLNENERLLEQAISKDIVNIVVTSTLNNAYEHVHECKRCVKLETKLQKDFIKTESYDKLFKQYTTLKKHCISLESQEKDMVIKKLKERIKPLIGNMKEEKIKQELEEIETINIELDHRVTKLIAENKHLKLAYKQLYESIKSSRVTLPTSASGSQPSGNTKKDKIHQTPSSAKKNKLESCPRNKPKESRNNVSVNKSKINKFLSAEKKEPNKSWGSTVSNVSSSSTNECMLSKLFSEDVDLLTGSRGNNLYTLSLVDMMASSPIYLLSKALKTKSWLWHRRLSHLNFGAINYLARQGLVRGLPKLKFEKDHLFSACTMGKSKKKSHKPKFKDTNQEKFYLLHMDLCGPMCLRSKDEAPDFIIKFLKMIQVRLKVPVRRIRTDNGTEFVNQTLREYYEQVDISHETSVARSPQQNGVIERRIHTLIEASRTMLIYAQALLFLWAEAVATACYTQNRSIVRLRHGKTPYELLHGKLPDLSFLYVFGALCYPTNDSKNLEKRTRRIIKTIHVNFDELTKMASEQSSSGPVLHEMTSTTISSGLVPNPTSSTPFVAPSRNDWDLLFQPLFDELLTPPPSVDPPVLEVIALIAKVFAPEPAESTGSPSSTTVNQDAPSPISTRLQLHEQALFCYYDAFLTSIEPNRYKDALTQSCWIEAMQEELNEFERIEVWELVPRPDKVMVITLKVFYSGCKIRGYKDFSHVCRSQEHGRLPNRCEDCVFEWKYVGRVYVSQPDVFVDPDNPNHVYKLRKALYGLKQAPRAYNDMLSSFLISQDFFKGSVDPTLFICRNDNDLLLVQIHVDDIIFAASTPELCDIFAKIMCSKFKMSMMGKISFFLGLQISQSPRGIFINQSKYAFESLKKYSFESCDLVDTPVVVKSKLDEDKEGKAVDPSHYHGSAYRKALTCGQKDLLIPTRNRQSGSMVSEGFFNYFTAFADADHAGCQDARRSTSGGLQFLGDRLISWSSKRQKSVAISSTEAEYIALSGCCAQILWMISQFIDYGLGFNKILMYCDNKSDIALCCNNVQHSRDNSFSQQSVSCFDKLFEINELNAQSQEKDMVIKKLKERTKSLSENMKEEKIKKELEKIETINIELDHWVTKLIAENEHLKQTYNQLYDSIKSSRIRSKEQCDDLIKQVNLKSAKNSDLNASLQEQVLVITALKDNLRKLKGKVVVDEAVISHSIDPELLKVDVAPLAPKLRNNRTVHSDYLKHTQDKP